MRPVVRRLTLAVALSVLLVAVDATETHLGDAEQALLGNDALVGLLKKGSAINCGVSAGFVMTARASSWSSSIAEVEMGA